MSPALVQETHLFGHSSRVEADFFTSTPLNMVYATVKLVAVCTRVAWFSHMSGGSKVHLLPEGLVNTDTHLDLLDSESEDASDFEELIEVQANG